MVRVERRRNLHITQPTTSIRTSGVLVNNSNDLKTTSYLFEPHDRKDEIAEFFGGLNRWRVFHPKIQLNSNLALDGNAKFLLKHKIKLITTFLIAQRCQLFSIQVNFLIDNPAA